MSVTTTTNSPQSFHKADAVFDLSRPFPGERVIEQEKALAVKKPGLEKIIALSKPQNALEEDLNAPGNIIFIGDTHLCHEFNEAAFEDILQTIKQWLKDGKHISRVVFSGDLVHKFDQRFTNPPTRESRAAIEPKAEVITRLERALRPLQNLRDIVGPKIEIDYIFGNHEIDLANDHPETKEILLRAIEEMNINLLTEDYQEVVSIGDKSDKIKMSHRPVFRWGNEYSRNFFGDDSMLFSNVNRYLKLRDKFSPDKGDIILGSHYHVPVVFKNGNITYTSTPSLIECFDPGVDTFPEAFMLINPKASRKIHMIEVSGKSMEYQVF